MRVSTMGCGFNENVLIHSDDCLSTMRCGFNENAL